ncbi:hypothetical protein [Halogranum rubrum]|uniref:GIY-YIG domain-containing protein n=1 Tax=Halogranum salarium B-1 TaxID=1210908 RepID=J3EVT0_9EURY|nr:hypothetical protein [Halogranum salarium]EJN58797.1 hypothetical protein HSB1_28780 [Halogranum salarium B-1]
MGRHDDLDRFYALLDELADRVGGPRKLKRCTGYMDWPDRGIYLFLEPGETRTPSDQPRVTRIGTHAISAGSKTSLWDRLKQHYGTGSASSNHPHGGNHRGSVYRKRVGEALIEKHALHDDYPSWDDRWSSLSRERDDVRGEEYIMERRVSAYIRDQPFLWLDVDDQPSKESDRRYIEENALALLSNFEKESIDPRTTDWLGRHSRSERIRQSGLWNVNHVDEAYDPDFLDRLARAVDETEPV